MSERNSPFHVVRSQPGGSSPLSDAKAAQNAAKMVARTSLSQLLVRLESDRAELVEHAELESLPPGVRDLAKRLADNIEASTTSLTQLLSRT